MKTYTLHSDSTPKNFKINYQKELNEEQCQAVKAGKGPALVLAGAGSGKTRVLVYRVAYLLENGVPPNRILLMTFTNKAAKEMLNRVAVILKTRPQGLWGGTFHHVGNRLLRQFGPAIKLNPKFNILDEEDSRALIKTCLNLVRLPQDKYFPKAELIKKIISLSANLMRPTSEIIASRFAQIKAEDAPLIQEIAKFYEQKKRESNALDFDDLLVQWHKLLIEAPPVNEKLARHFQHILIDEYQDTNALQGEIIRRLAGERQNVLAVGDDCQSIYSFRGADVNNILRFPEIFPATETFKLETNYRSTPEILNLANESIVFNEKQFKKQLRARKPSGRKPALATVDDVFKQAEFVAQRILDLAAAGIGLNQIAVLFRAHFQSLELEMELNKRNIPYVMRGGLRFFEQAHIKDVLSYLKILINHRDGIAWQRALLLQNGVGPINAQKIYQSAARASSLKLIIGYNFQNDSSAKALAGWQAVKNILTEMLEAAPDDASALIEIVLNGGYREYLKNYYENFNDRLADLEQLVIFAKNYKSLSKFLADAALGEGFKGETVLANENGQNQPAANSDAVTLSTIHQAKGLEWRAVFIIGLVDGQFPNLKFLSRADELEEERRLFYVALTRAQDQLYLVYPLINQRDIINQPSTFIKELPKGVLAEWRIDEAMAGDELVYTDENEDSDVSANFWQRVIARRNK